MATRLPRKQSIFLMFSVMSSHVAVILLTFVVKNGNLRAGGSAIDTGVETTRAGGLVPDEGMRGSADGSLSVLGADAPPPPLALRSVTVR